MKTAFTGSRRGTTPAQRAELRAALLEIGATCVHHGDCVGADADMHAIAQSLQLPIILHPPSDTKHRAFCGGAASSLPPLRYLQRNQAIVHACEILLAAPDGAERVRSGTWATIRAAMRAGKRVIIVLPTGVRAGNEPNP